MPLPARSLPRPPPQRRHGYARGAQQRAEVLRVGHPVEGEPDARQRARRGNRRRRVERLELERRRVQDDALVRAVGRQPVERALVGAHDGQVEAVGELDGLVEWGASPRGTIALDRCARARAWLSHRDYVTPEDVHTIAGDVLRHRVLMTYEARAQGVDADAFLHRLMQAVPLP